MLIIMGEQGGYVYNAAFSRVIQGVVGLNQRNVINLVIYLIK